MKWALSMGALAALACTPATPQKWAVPAKETVTCAPWAEVPHHGKVYFNNVWNAQAAGGRPWTQCIVRDPTDADRLGFYWKWPDSGREIYAQPQAKLGVSPWDPQPKLDDRFPMRIGDIESLTVITDVSVEGPSEYNVVTTLWLTDSGNIGPEPQPSSIVAEVMIWNYATANQLSPAGRKIGSIRQGTEDWDVWLEENWHDVSGANRNRWIYVALVAPRPFGKF